jgi:3-phenylpropionate/trans-cinnamate dioxygenase ferredoxin reductase subunit
VAKRTFVIVGASLAGSSAAATLREEGFDGRVVLLSAEREEPYDRPPLSKDYLAGQRPLERIRLRPEGFWEEQAIELRVGTVARRIDPASRTVELDGGELLAYERLLLATGGRNRRPPIAGIDLQGVLSLRTRLESDAIRAAASGGGRVVVVGMGFIGSEVAASLRGLGVDVVTIEPFEVPLERALGVDVGRVLAELHDENGVECVFGEGVDAFEGQRKLEGVRTSSGRVVECDVAVVGIGIEPVTDLAATAGVQIENGVVVDALCRTTVEGVYAAGDVANHFHPLYERHIRVEHWKNAVEQGAAAARSMLDQATPYAELHWFWSDQYDANIQYAGHHTVWDELIVRGSLAERKFVAFYLAEGVPRAAVSMNAGRDLRRSFGLLQAGRAVDPAALTDPDTDLRALASSGA